MKRPFLADLEGLLLSNIFQKAQELELLMLDINSVEIPRLNLEIQFGIYNFSN